MRRIYTFLFLFLLTNNYLFSQKVNTYRLGELLVKTENINLLLHHFQKNNISNSLTLLTKHGNIYKVEFDDRKIATAKMKSMISPLVEIVQFNHILELRSTPNDGYYDEQWDMEIIDAPKAWDLTTGGVTTNGDTIVVAMIDSGVDWNNKDLKANLWYNRQEVPNDGIDNDMNGFIDDYRGWVIPDSNDQHFADFHGTAVASIMGAKGNNDYGLAGVNWDVKIMVLSKALSEAELVQAYDYILDMRLRYDASNGAEGAYVVATNLSIGLTGNPDDFPLWCGVYDKLGSAGILNVGATVNNAFNVDEVGDLPTGCTSDYLVSVTNTDKGDSLRRNAGYGVVSIDLGAPGSGTPALSPFGVFDIFGSTSAATPHVTGAIALLYSLPSESFATYAKEHPAQTALLIKDVLLKGVDIKESLKGKSVSGGRLNVNNSLNLLKFYFESETSELNVLRVFPNPTTDFLTMEYSFEDNTAVEITIMDILGQTIYETIHTPNGTLIETLQLNVETLQRGVYFVILKNKEQRIVTQFVRD